MTNKKKRLLVLDAMNLYVRSYTVNPTLTPNGMPIGGCIGFLKSLQKYMREISPDEIIVVWDGEGGSKRKKAMNKGYKSFRTPARLNRNIRVLTEKEEQANKWWQMGRLIEQLNQLPVIQIMVANVEADDIVAILARDERYNGWQKVILSSDKDFLQLCDGETVVYRPMKDEYYTWKKVLDEYAIHPANFALARSMTSDDKSDNIRGIDGIGMKTVAKRLPMLTGSIEMDVNDVINHCEEQIEGGSKIKAYEAIAKGRFIIEDNYKLMQLYRPMISPNAMQMIEEAIEGFKPEFNFLQFSRTLIEDGVASYSWDQLEQWCNRTIFNWKQEQQNKG